MSKMQRILVIDDDPEISRIISEVCALEFPSDVQAVVTGGDGIAMGAEEEHDLIILDLTLPDLSGLDVCKKLREQGVQTPIICLTSRAEPIDKIVGFENGADDYVTKPFDPRELVARMKAVQRRTELSVRKPVDEPAGSIECGELVIELDTHRLFLSGREVVLTRTEFLIVSLLAQNQGRVFPREELLQSVLGYSISEYDQSITSHICRIRAKIEKDPDRPVYIRTVRGVGYRFSTDEEIASAE